MPSQSDVSFPERWLEKPCAFHLPHEAATVCGYCREGFTVWRSRRTCEFCGNVFHRRSCTRKRRVEGELFRAHICLYCDRYLNESAEKLRKGESFVCHSGRTRSRSKVFLLLSEERGQLVVRSDPDPGEHGHGAEEEEAFCLDEIDVQQGFSHRGYLRTLDYEPLRSWSLIVSSPSPGLHKSFELEAETAWTCKFWVDGLKAAKYAYQSVMEQQLLQAYCKEKGITVHERGSWFKRNYIPWNDKQYQTFLGKRKDASPCLSRPVSSYSLTSSSASSSPDFFLSHNSHWTLQPPGGGGSFNSGRRVTDLRNPQVVRGPNKKSVRTWHHGHRPSPRAAAASAHSPRFPPPAFPSVVVAQEKSPLSSYCSCHEHQPPAPYHHHITNRSLSMSPSPVQSPLDRRRVFGTPHSLSSRSPSPSVVPPSQQEGGVALASSSCCPQCRMTCQIAMVLDNL